jgi:4-amino-4-deoxy-L-arabinose transferase-like glycosyltransferase
LATLFVSYAWFFQGGGWNQNSRFAQVRSIVEQGSTRVNNYLVYRVEEETGGRSRLRRHPLPPGTPLSDVRDLAVTGDLAKYAPDDAFYPNKPPGTVWLAVPGYWVVHAVERMLGVDPDDWWPLTVNAYLATLLSVGLTGAFGGMLFLFVSRRLFPEAPAWTHAASALTFGLGTLWLPFSTMLFDHVEAAVLLLLSFACLLRQREVQSHGLWMLAAGAAAGAAVLVNYLSVLPAALLLGYAVAVTAPRTHPLLFLLGGVPAGLLLAWYHASAFGSPLSIANTFQSEMFRREDLVLGVFGLPRPEILWQLLFGTRRGLFLTSPVLLLAFAGLFRLLRNRERRAEGLLFFSCFALLWLVNSAFREWHAGFSLGPRYLIPALPFVCLPLATVFRSWPRTTIAVAALSALIVIGATAVDAQPPPKFVNPLRQYLAPLAAGKTILIQQIPIEGPVSVNPIGVYESWYYKKFRPGSPQARRASFNLGEAIWPRSWVSLLPLGVVLAGGLLLLRRRLPRATSTSPRD